MAGPVIMITHTQHHFGRSTMSNKKRKCLSLSEKIDVIKYAKANPSVGARKLAGKFEIGRTQVRTILQKKESLIASFESHEGPQTNLKRFRTGKFSDVNKALWDWYNCCRISNIAVSGRMLQEEAQIIAKKLEVSGFAASNGWLESFKRLHNICNMQTVAGEEGGVNPDTIQSWNERAREITRGWNPSDVWNMDQTGSFWRGLPEKSLSGKGKRCSGGKKCKQRNTWVFFVNAAGGKEQPIVIGKSEKPRCFKNLENKECPCNCQ